MHFEADVDYSQVPEIELANPTSETQFAEAAQNDFEGLLLLGYLTDSFDIFGHSFTIRTLRIGEKIAVAQIIADLADSIALGDASMAATVAACTMMVDNKAMKAPLGSDEAKNPAIWIRQNLVTVHQWFDPVIETVWQRYLSLLQKQAAAFLAYQEK